MLHANQQSVKMNNNNNIINSLMIYFEWLVLEERHKHHASNI